MLAMMVLVKFSFNPLALFAEATRQYGAGVLAPGRFVSDPVDGISLGLALMFGTAGLPHILMRFYTVPDARTARVSVAYATAVIGAFYLLTFILGFGAMVLVGQTGDSRRSMPAATWRRRSWPRPSAARRSSASFPPSPSPRFSRWSPGLTLAGAAALSHDIYVHVFRSGRASEKEELMVARGATILLAVFSIVLGIVFKGQNVAYMVGLAFAIAASANFPALVLSMFWRPFTTRGAQASILFGTVATLVLIYLSPTIQIDLLKHTDRRIFRIAIRGCSPFRCRSSSASSCRCWRPSRPPSRASPGSSTRSMSARKNRRACIRQSDTDRLQLARPSATPSSRVGADRGRRAVPVFLQARGGADAKCGTRCRRRSGSRRSRTC